MKRRGHISTPNARREMTQLRLPPEHKDDLLEVDPSSILPINSKSQVRMDRPSSWFFHLQRQRQHQERRHQQEQQPQTEDEQQQTSTDMKNQRRLKLRPRKESYWELLRRNAQQGWPSSIDLNQFANSLLRGGMKIPAHEQQEEISATEAAKAVGRRRRRTCITSTSTSTADDVDIDVDEEPLSKLAALALSLCCATIEPSSSTTNDDKSLLQPLSNVLPPLASVVDAMVGSTFTFLVGTSVGVHKAYLNPQRRQQASSFASTEKKAAQHYASYFEYCGLGKTWCEISLSSIRSDQMDSSSSSSPSGKERLPCIVAVPQRTKKMEVVCYSFRPFGHHNQTVIHWRHRGVGWGHSSFEGPSSLCEIPPSSSSSSSKPKFPRTLIAVSEYFRSLNPSIVLLDASNGSALHVLSPSGGMPRSLQYYDDHQHEGVDRASSLLIIMDMASITAWDWNLFRAHYADDAEAMLMKRRANSDSPDARSTDEIISNDLQLSELRYDLPTRDLHLTWPSVILLVDQDQRAAEQSHNDCGSRQQLRFTVASVGHRGIVLRRISSPSPSGRVRSRVRKPTSPHPVAAHVEVLCCVTFGQWVDRMRSAVYDARRGVLAFVACDHELFLVDVRPVLLHHGEGKKEEEAPCPLPRLLMRERTDRLRSIALVYF